MQHKIRDLTSKTWWLVMAGSGMRLYAFLGALLALLELGFRFHGMTVTSGGAVVGGVMAKYYNPADPVRSFMKVLEVASEVNPSKVLTLRWRIWEWMLTTVFRRGPKGALATRALLALFRKIMPPTIGAACMPIRICSYQVNLKSPVPVTFAADDVDLPLAVLGSMNLPVFDPTHYGPALLQDGGWVRNFNIPDTEANVLGLYFGGATKGPEEGIVTDEDQLVPIEDNLQLLGKAFGGVIEDNMRRSIEEAEEEGVNLLKVPLRTSMGTLDFFASREKIDLAIKEGYDSVMAQFGR